MNRSSSTAIDCKTLIEVWSGKPVEYTVLEVFGCHACYHVNDGKLNPMTKKGIFIGYGSGVKRYCIWTTDPTSKLVVIRYITFDEMVMIHPKEPIISLGKENDVSKQVELEATSSEISIVSITIHPVSE